MTLYIILTLAFGILTIVTVVLREAYNKGREAELAKACDKLSELKSAYEKDLDTEPRIYERYIQLCAKLSLVEKLILELKEE